MASNTPPPNDFNFIAHPLSPDTLHTATTHHTDPWRTLEALHRHISPMPSPAQLTHFLTTPPLEHILVYGHPKESPAPPTVLGMFSLHQWEITPSHWAAELHAIIRSDLPSLYPKTHKALKRHLILWVFDTLFAQPQLQEIYLKADPHNKGVRGLSFQWGCKKLPQPDPLGRHVWILTQTQFNLRRSQFNSPPQIKSVKETSHELRKI